MQDFFCCDSSLLLVFQRSSPASSKKLVVKVVLGLVTLTLIVAATLTAVFLGGKITKEAVQVNYYHFQTYVDHLTLYGGPLPHIEKGFNSKSFQVASPLIIFPSNYQMHQEQVENDSLMIVCVGGVGVREGDLATYCCIDNS